MNEPAPTPLYGFDQRWHPALKDDGFVQVSTFFLENYHRLHPCSLTHGEAMFVIHLMQHKWGEEAPFPSYATLAQRMLVTVKTARRLAASLQAKKLLHRELRVGAPNRFHLGPLIAALVKLKESDETEARKGRAVPRRKKA